MLLVYCVICMPSAIYDWITVGFGYSPSSIFYPALDLKVKPKHPVFLIPGVLCTKLESWSVLKKSCERYPGQYYRSSVFGMISGVIRWFYAGPCILDMFDLDVEEGRDSPKGFKVRAGTGFQSSDYFAAGVPLWAKVIANLGAIGYDTGNMAIVSYDWRLAYSMMEKRDSTFTRLKSEIEILTKTTNEKAVLVSHSFGGNFVHYFMHWINNLDPEWINVHIHAWVSNGTPLLGSLKALSTVIAGYTGETASQLARLVMEFTMKPDIRQHVIGHIRSLYSAFPMGGNRIWGNSSYNPAWKQFNAKFNESTGGQLFTLFHNHLPTSAVHADNVSDYILSKLDPHLQKYAHLLNYKGNGPINATDSGSWINPLANELPKGNYTIYCTYGIGIPTPNSYAFTETNSRFDFDQKTKKMGYKNGEFHVDGDVTVTLTSLGYVCESAWRKKRNNPHNVKIVTKEYPGEDHLKALQNDKFLTDLLTIASGGQVSQTIFSNISAIVHQIDS